MSQVHIHPDYDKNKKDNDIAILKLKICLSFNKNVQPACLPESLDFTGANALFSGWGTSKHLRYATMPVITNKKCVKPYAYWDKSMLTSNMICAQGFNTPLCFIIILLPLKRSFSQFGS